MNAYPPKRIHGTPSTVATIDIRVCDGRARHVGVGVLLIVADSRSLKYVKIRRRPHGHTTLYVYPCHPEIKGFESPAVLCWDVTFVIGVSLAMVTV